MTNKYVNDLAADYIRKILRYEPDTGKFFWIERAAARPVNRPAGTKTDQGYVVIGINGRQYPAHRLAFLIMDGVWPEEVVDHANMVRDDNRWSNLRRATLSQNQANGLRSVRNNSGVKGVHFNKFKGLWEAAITLNGKKKYLGSYGSLEIAEKVYKKAAEEKYGEFYRHDSVYSNRKIK